MSSRQARFRRLRGSSEVNLGGTNNSLHHNGDDERYPSVRKPINDSQRDRETDRLIDQNSSSVEMTSQTVDPVADRRGLRFDVDRRDELEHQTEDSPRTRQNPTSVSKFNDQHQDIEGQKQRIKLAQDAFLSSAWCCFPTLANVIRWGYLLNEFQRRGNFDLHNQGLSLSQLQERYLLGITIKCVQSYKRHLIGLVKPFVRVQVVDLETGFHLKSPTFSAVRPKFTHGLRSGDGPSIFSWNQDLTFDLPYSAVVSERALYLFEIIDEQPSLSVRSNLNNQGLSVFKKVAWAYLLPIGIDGQLNVGLPALFAETGESRPVAEESTATDDPLPPPHDLFRNSQQKDRVGKDLHLRLQLYEYRQYDGALGTLQRSALHWPRLSEPYIRLAFISLSNTFPLICSDLNCTARKKSRTQQVSLPSTCNGKLQRRRQSMELSSRLRSDLVFPYEIRCLHCHTKKQPVKPVAIVWIPSKPRPHLVRTR